MYHSEQSTFERAPITSVIALGSFFGLLLIISSGITRNFCFALAFSVSLTITAGIGFAIGGTWKEPVNISCEDAWSKNLGIGVLLGLHLSVTAFYAIGAVLGAKEKERRERVYSRSAIPLQGTVVGKSKKKVGDSDSSTTYFYLCVRYNFYQACPGSSRMANRHRSSGNNELELVPSHRASHDPKESSQAQWSYCVDDLQNLWENYDDHCNSQLETAFRDGDRFSPATIKGILVDFSIMRQTDASTGNSQKVQRRIAAADPSNTTDEFLPPDDHFALSLSSATNNGKDSTTSNFPTAFGNESYPDLLEHHDATGSNYSQNETIRPFRASYKAYEDAAIDRKVDLLCLPGNPFSATLKSEFEGRNWCAIWALLLVCPLGFYYLPMGLGYYLPIRIENWDLCRISVIVCLSAMVVTAILLCGCCRIFCCCGPPRALIKLEAQDIIQSARNKLRDSLHNEVDTELSWNRRKLAALDSLEDQVVHHLDNTNTMNMPQYGLQPEDMALTRNQLLVLVFDISRAFEYTTSV